MTAITGAAGVLIVSYFVVVTVRIGLVMRVAGRAVERRIIGRDRMAFDTIVPSALM